MPLPRETRDRTSSRRNQGTHVVEHLRAAPAPPRAVVEVVRGVRLVLEQQLRAQEAVDLLQHVRRVHLPARRLDRQRQLVVRLWRARARVAGVSVR